jgi:hypothetical protein
LSKDDLSIAIIYALSDAKLWISKNRRTMRLLAIAGMIAAAAIVMVIELPATRLAVYMGFCYLAIVLANSVFQRACYAEVKIRSSALEKEEWFERERRGGGSTEILKCGNWLRFSSKKPRYGWLSVPALLIFVVVLLLKLHVPPVFYRQVLIFTTFFLVCIIATSISRHRMGLDGAPSVTVLFVSGLYAGLFWWLDYLSLERLRGLLAAAEGSREGLRLLFSYASQSTYVAVLILVAGCISLPLSLVSFFGDERHSKAGITRWLILETLWFTLWAVLTLLAGVARNAGWLMTEIVTQM